MINNDRWRSRLIDIYAPGTATPNGLPAESPLHAWQGRLDQLGSHGGDLGNTARDVARSLGRLIGYLTHGQPQLGGNLERSGLNPFDRPLETPSGLVELLQAYSPVQPSSSRSHAARPLADMGGVLTEAGRILVQSKQENRSPNREIAALMHRVPQHLRQPYLQITEFLSLLREKDRDSGACLDEMRTAVTGNAERMSIERLLAASGVHWEQSETLRRFLPQVARLAKTCGEHGINLLKHIPESGVLGTPAPYMRSLARMMIEREEPKLPRLDLTSLRYQPIFNALNTEYLQKLPRQYDPDQSRPSFDNRTIPAKLTELACLSIPIQAQSRPDQGPDGVPFVEALDRLLTADDKRVAKRMPPGFTVFDRYNLMSDLIRLLPDPRMMSTRGQPVPAAQAIAKLVENHWNSLNDDYKTHLLADVLALGLPSGPHQDLMAPLIKKAAEIPAASLPKIASAIFCTPKQPWVGIKAQEAARHVASETIKTLGPGSTLEQARLLVPVCRQLLDHHEQQLKIGRDEAQAKQCIERVAASLALGGLPSGVECALRNELLAAAGAAEDSTLLKCMAALCEGRSVTKAPVAPEVRAATGRYLLDLLGTGLVPGERAAKPLRNAVNSAIDMMNDASPSLIVRGSTAGDGGLDHYFKAMLQEAEQRQGGALDGTIRARLRQAGARALVASLPPRPSADRPDETRDQTITKAREAMVRVARDFSLLDAPSIRKLGDWFNQWLPEDSPEERSPAADRQHPLMALGIALCHSEAPQPGVLARFVSERLPKLNSSLRTATLKQMFDAYADPGTPRSGRHELHALLGHLSDHGALTDALREMLSAIAQDDGKAPPGRVLTQHERAGALRLVRNLHGRNPVDCDGEDQLWRNCVGDEELEAIYREAFPPGETSRTGPTRPSRA